MPPIVTEPDLLRQDDVDRLLGVGSQEEIPLLPHKLPVPAVGHPHLAAVEEDDACRDQHHQTGEETQNHETDDLAAGDQRSRCLNRPEKLVESRRGVVLRFNSALELVDVKFTRRPGESGRAGAADPAVCAVHAGASVHAAAAGTRRETDAADRAREGRRTDAGVFRVPTDAPAAVHARIGLADVRLDLTERAGESRWTEAGGTAVRADRVQAGSSVLTARAADEREDTHQHTRFLTLQLQSESTRLISASAPQSIHKPSHYISKYQNNTLKKLG